MIWILLNWKSILNTAGVVALAVVIILLVSAQGEIKQQKNNVSELMSKDSTLILTLNQKQFKQSVKLNELSGINDSLLKILKVKPRQITRIETVKVTNTIHDTITLTKEVRNGVSVLFCDTLCINQTFILDTITNRLKMTYFNYSQEFTIVEYYKRKRIMWLPIGRKFEKVSVLSSCTGDTVSVSRIIRVD